MKLPFTLVLFFLIALSLTLLACSLVTGAAPPSAAAPTLDLTAEIRSAILTATHSVSTPLPLPSATPTPPAAATPTEQSRPSAVRTPPALPAVFTTGLLNPKDPPHTYVTDTCQYLKNRWDPAKSEPGTVVMAVMFHSIVHGGVVKNDQINVTKFRHLMRDLYEQGFQTITAAQLADFLETNAKIPPRSMLLLVDDRHHADYYYDHFVPFLSEYGWTVTNAWISTDLSTDELVDSMVDVIEAGWVDIQAHGVVHNIPINSHSTDEFIHSELYGSIEYIQEKFNRTPIAYIWPTGSFTRRGVEVARQAGYRIGFTINPRGPVMYNWVPLGAEHDPGRKTFLAEGPVNDPLMVLPRFWDTDASQHIDTVRQIGKEAAAYAQNNRQTELDYYDIVCEPVTGKIPGR